MSLCYKQIRVKWIYLQRVYAESRIYLHHNRLRWEIWTCNHWKRSISSFSEFICKNVIRRLILWWMSVMLTSLFALYYARLLVIILKPIKYCALRIRMDRHYPPFPNLRPTRIPVLNFICRWTQNVNVSVKANGHYSMTLIPLRHRLSHDGRRSCLIILLTPVTLTTSMPMHDCLLPQLELVFF